MSERYIFAVALFTIMTSAGLSLFAVCGYLIKYVQLMPGQLKDVRKTQRAGGVLAVLGFFILIWTVYAFPG